MKFTQASLFPEPPKPKKRSYQDDWMEWNIHNAWFPQIGNLTFMPVISQDEYGEGYYTQCQLGYINEIKQSGEVIVCCEGRKLIIDIYECSPPAVFYPYGNEWDYKINFQNVYL